MTPAMPRELRATVLVNPAARRVPAGFDGMKLVRYLATHNVEATLVVPDSSESATREAQISADRQDDLCFVVGGDGSVRDAALGLAGSETALAAIPAGTVNVWTKEAGIPPGILPAIDAHIEGQSVHMDLGRAGNSCFLLMAGIGWDAEIASRVPTRLKRLTGDIAYILQAALMAPVLRSKVTRWSTAEGPTEEQLAWMVLSNTRLYGGKVRLASTATIDDGALDVLAFCPERLSDTVRLVAKIAAGKREDPRLLQFQAPELTIESPGIPVQLDGDHIGETPMKFSIDPAALLVSVPAGPLSEVFSRPHINHREP